ncbi:MAG: response regulator [Planctomycetes bacterium]|nr:response regulator [Planctomycetota bacterium]
MSAQIIVPNADNDPFAPFREMVGHQKILVVDDEKVVRRSLGLYLSRIGFATDEAENGLEAKNCLEQNRYFLIFTDITMPEMNGLDLLKHVRELDREIDVVMITGHMNIEYAIKAIKKGAFDYLKKPFLLENVHATLMRVLEKQALKRKSIELELLQERHRTEEKNLTEFMIMLANIIDAKSTHTLEHSERVSELSVKIGMKIGLEKDLLNKIALGAKLHDIGKLGTPDYILNKNGPLTREEYEIIKEHPAKGANMIQPISSLREIIDIVHYHHENLDGSGYPEGLVKDQIPLSALIVRIADYWDAITSARPYREPMSFEKASGILFSEVEANKVDREFVDALMEEVALIHV